MEGEAPERHGEEGEGEGEGGISSESASSSSSVPSSSSSVSSADLSDAPSSSFFSAQPNNTVEAEEALEFGLRAARQEDAYSLEKAERLLAKSVRLKRTTEACQALERVQRRRAQLYGSNQQQNRPSNSSRREGEPMRPSSSNPRPPAAAAAAAAAAESQPGAAAANSSYSHPPPPPRPFPPGSAAAAAAAAAAQPPTWRAHTLTAPAFLTTRFPSLAGRRWTYQYPGFFYIPPSQRRPIAFVWGIVFVLCLFRLLGLMSGGRGHYDPLEFDSNMRRRRHREREREPVEDAEERSDGRWSSTAYSTTYRSGNFMMSINNLFTLLPFLFFFIGPLVQRLIQEHQARRNYQAQQQQQQQQPHQHNQ